MSIQHINTSPLGDSKPSNDMKDNIEAAYGKQAPISQTPNSAVAAAETNLKEAAENHKASSKFHNVKTRLSEDLEKIRKMTDTPPEYLEEVTKDEAGVQAQLDDIINKESQAKALANEADKLAPEITKAEEEAQKVLDGIKTELENTKQQLEGADCEADPTYCKAFNERIEQLGKMQAKSLANLDMLEKQKENLSELKEYTTTIAKHIQDALAGGGNQDRQPGTNDQFREQFKDDLAEAKAALSALASAISGLLSKALDLFKGIISAVAGVKNSTADLESELKEIKSNEIKPTSNPDVSMH